MITQPYARKIKQHGNMYPVDNFNQRAAPGMQLAIQKPRTFHHPAAWINKHRIAIIPIRTGRRYMESGGEQPTLRVRVEERPQLPLGGCMAVDSFNQLIQRAISLLGAASSFFKQHWV